MKYKVNARLYTIVIAWYLSRLPVHLDPQRGDGSLGGWIWRGGFTMPSYIYLCCDRIANFKQWQCVVEAAGYLVFMSI
jgi:hypothetical protein